MCVKVKPATHIHNKHRYCRPLSPRLLFSVNYYYQDKVLLHDEMAYSFSSTNYINSAQDCCRYSLSLYLCGIFETQLSQTLSKDGINTKNSPFIYNTIILIQIYIPGQLYHIWRFPFVHGYLLFINVSKPSLYFPI